MRVIEKYLRRDMGVIYYMPRGLKRAFREINEILDENDMRIIREKRTCLRELEEVLRNSHLPLELYRGSVENDLYLVYTPVIPLNSEIDSNL